MPFKHYHGRTGRVFNVTKRAVGVIINKEVNGRIIKKRLNISVPHVMPSKCQAGDFAVVCFTLRLDVSLHLFYVLFQKS